MKRALFLLLSVMLLFAEAGGRAQGPDALSYARSFLLTGNYVVASVDLPRGGGQGVLTFTSAQGNAVPADAEISAAYLYWEALAPVGAPLGPAKFRGVDIATAKASRLVDLPGGDSASCWGSSGGGDRILTMYRADVLPLLPKLYDVNDRWTGRYRINDLTHTVELGTPGDGNTLATVAGASLLIVYRDLSEPLRKVVIYDGVHAQAQAESTSQIIGGFYRSSLARSARVTHIAGSGARNDADRLLFNGQLIATNAFPDPVGSGSDRGWASPTFDVTLQMPGTEADGFGETVSTSVDHEGSNPNAAPYECLAWAAIVFSTSVADTDRDGLPDALEEPAGSELMDPPAPAFPSGQPLPDLYGMGARVGEKNLFVEVNAMTALPGTSYGSPAAPYNDDHVTVTDPVGHVHMPSPAVIKMVGDVYLAANIKVHFDVGNLDVYRGLGADYACLDDPDNEECAALPYLVPSAFARGGELITERASAGGQFTAFPGTVGWPFGMQVYREAPVGDAGEELGTEEIRAGWLDGTRRRRFDRDRHDYFHYALYAHARGRAKSGLPCLDENGDPTDYPPDANTCPTPNPQFHVPSSVSGVADLPGGNLLITLGLWDSEKFVAPTFPQASTTLHELGHNGHLWHGGRAAVFGDKELGTETVVEPNCKPNYLSSMSYLFQVHGMFDDSGRPNLDYSDREHASLFEGGLLEAPLSPLPKYRPSWFASVDSDLARDQGAVAARRFCNGAPFDPDAPPDPGSARLRALSTDASINWDGNPGASPSADINFDGSATETLDGVDDWANFRLDQIRAGRVARVFATAEGDLIDFGSGDLIDFGSGDLIDFGSGDLIDFGSGTHLVHLGSGDFLKYGSGDLIDFGSGDLIDFGSGVFMPGPADVGYSAGDLIDFGSGDLIDFGSGDLIDFGSGDLIDFGSGDLIDFGSGDLIDFGSGDVIDFGSGSRLQELDFEIAFELGAPQPHGLNGCVLGEDCVDSQPSDPHHRVRLAWSAPTFGSVAEYEVYRTTGSMTPVLVGTTSDLTIVDSEELPHDVFFTYWVRARFSDGSTGPNSDVVVIRAVNDAPLAADDAFTTARDTPLIVPAAGVLDNDSDADSPSTSLRVATAGTHPTENGTVTINADGSFTYTPNTGFFGSDTFTYRANNGVWPRDEDVLLSEESNPATVTITVSQEPPDRPDLVVTKLAGRSVAGFGTAYTVKGTVRNVGNRAAPPTSTSYYLSNNPTLDGGDTFLGSRAVPELAPGAKHVGAVTFTIPPGAPGKYFLIARADAGAAAAESNEDNNTRSKRLFIGPDLHVARLTSPASASRGSSVLITVSTRNAGGNGTGPTVTRVYLSADNKVNAGDALLVEIEVPGLAPSGTYVKEVSVTIPAETPIGGRHVVAQADAGAAVAESREANNVRSSVVTIQP